MTLNTVKDQELSLWIGKKLGYEKACYGRWHAPDCKHPIRDGSCCGLIEKLPDFVNDPAMTVMLMEKLRAVGHLQLFAGLIQYTDFRAAQRKHECRHATLGRAVAEAFALAHDWTP